MALVPETVSRFVKSNVAVRVARGAGEAAAFPDDLYAQAGATFADDERSLAADADVLVSVGRPSDELLAALRPGTVVVGFLNPLGDPAYVQRLAQAQGDGAGDGDDPAHHARAIDGRALVAEQHRRLQSRPLGRRRAAEILSDAHDRRRHDSARESCSCSARASPDCKRSRRAPAARRGRQRLRRARGRERTSPVAGREISGVRPRRGRATAGGYAKELTPEQQERQRAWMVEQIGANDVVVTTALVPGRKAPMLVSEAAVAAMKPGQRDRGSRRRSRRQLRAHDRRAKSSTSPNGVTIVGTTNLP